MTRVVDLKAHIAERRPELAAETGPLTEHRAAQVFAERYRDHFLYHCGRGAWLAYDGGIWRPEETLLVHDCARLVAADLASEKERRTAERAAFCTGMLTHARADRAFAREAAAFDANPDLLGVPGGMVDLFSGVLLAADPGTLLTRSTAVAPAFGGACPLWLRFLDEATGSDAALIRFLQLFCGYCLTGHVIEHVLVFIFGPGGNGKSVFLNVLTRILGDYAAVAAMEAFTASKFDKHPTDLAMLAGARLVTSSETEQDRSWAEARIKQMTGGDAITARFLHRNPFTYRPQFKLMIVGNHQPKLTNVDDALRRRFRIVPFERKPAKPDKDLEKKLEAEWPAILAWMIEGCVAWRAEGGLPAAASVTAATATYFSDQDLFQQWVDDECVAEPGNPSRWALSAELFKSWSDYAKAAGEDAGSRKAFANQMHRRKFELEKLYKGRGFRGIELRQPARRDEER